MRQMNEMNFIVSCSPSENKAMPEEESLVRLGTAFKPSEFSLEFKKFLPCRFVISECHHKRLRCVRILCIFYSFSLFLALSTSDEKYSAERRNNIFQRYLRERITFCFSLVVFSSCPYFVVISA